MCFAAGHHQPSTSTEKLSNLAVHTVCSDQHSVFAVAVVSAAAAAVVVVVVVVVVVWLLLLLLLLVLCLQQRPVAITNKTVPLWQQWDHSNKNNNNNSNLNYLGLLLLPLFLTQRFFQSLRCS